MQICVNNIKESKIEKKPQNFQAKNVEILFLY